MNKENKSDMIFAACIIAAACIFFYYILGISGALSIFGIALIFCFPTYMILRNFDIDSEEKILLSFFIGIGIFTPISYWIGMFISFRIAIFISIAILAGIGLLMQKYMNHSQNKT